MNWINFTIILLPGLLGATLSALPLAIGTISAVRQLLKANTHEYLRNIWGSTAAGVVALGLLFDRLFGEGTDPFIFLVVPIVSGLALKVGRGSNARTYQKAEKTGEILIVHRLLICVPVAMLSVLMFGIVKNTIDDNGSYVAQLASDPETLHWVYERAVSSKKDDFGVSLSLAQNNKTPADILKKLSKHKYLSVRIFVASNPNTPLDVVASLKDDCSPKIRKVVQGRLKLPSESNNALRPTLSSAQASANVRLCQ